jgi:hypothetical protein
MGLKNDPALRNFTIGRPPSHFLPFQPHIHLSKSSKQARGIHLLDAQAGGVVEKTGFEDRRE